jgi:hypothetical protein
MPTDSDAALSTKSGPAEPDEMGAKLAALARRANAAPRPSARPVREHGTAGCALCGFTPESSGDQQLRLLGAQPVVITVCSDGAACVTRYASAMSPGAS